MWIQVRTMDGKKSFQVDGLSKLTKIEDLRIKMEEELEVPPSRQRLFFAGKQLEDGHSLFDYNVGLNSLIQVMIRVQPTNEQCAKEISLTDENKENIQKEENFTKVEEKDEMEIKPDIKSFWKVGDFVDGKDLSMGAWFEGEIKTVELDENNVVKYGIIFDGYDEAEIVTLSDKSVRPRACTNISFDKVEKGMLIMANYNCDEPKERGFWYDVQVTRKATKRNNNEVYGKLLLEKDTSEECKIIFTDELFQIEKTAENQSELTDNNSNAPERRKVKPNCDHCKDDVNKSCKHCSCHECGEKDEPEKTLMCDECDNAYHMRCLNPPLTTLPEDDEWYCPLCKNDGSQIIKAGQKLKESKKKSKMASANSKSTRDWGKGMACVGRTKICSIVPSNHFGPIPGVPVGSCWKYRVQASEAGVHRPHVSGMHGRDSEGAFSIVLAGGYEDDTDDGDEFTYTGSGGRDLSGNKRTAEQSFDQTLTKTNRALAKNCDCPVDNKTGGKAKDWKKGLPLRVIRSYKFAKHSEYAPEDGIRYDGIYKVIKYWPEKGQSGFIVWRYRLRRDDESPAPWTDAGKKNIEELGLEIVYPDGYLEAQAKKEADKQASKNEKKNKRKRVTDEEEDSSDKGNSDENQASPKKTKVAYEISQENLHLIKDDIANEKIWLQLQENLESQKKFLQAVEDRFMCICCQEVVSQPITVDCGHSTCKPCLSRAFKADVNSCPSCRFSLDKDFDMVVNEPLSKILKKLFPGYDAGR